MAAQITSINPTSAKAGAEVTIKGSGFTGATKVQFQDEKSVKTEAKFTVLNEATIVVAVPKLSPGSYRLFIVDYSVLDSLPANFRVSS